jgi:hypothetical protein
MSAIFAMLLPRTTPKDKFGAPSRAEVIPTKSSGNEVPKAKTMAAIVKMAVWASLAILLIATITISADLINKREKKIINATRPGII